MIWYFFTQIITLVIEAEATMSAMEKFSDILTEFSEKNGNKEDNIETKMYEMFEFLDEHFNELYEPENLNGVVQFLHRMFEQLNITNSLEDGVSACLMCFLDRHKNNEKELNITVQIIFQVLNSIKYLDKEIKIANRVFVELINLLPTIKNRSLLSGIIACLQLYVIICPKNLDIMETLWSDLSRRLQNASPVFVNDTDIDILIQLYDEFYKINPMLHEDATVVTTIQQLLKSDKRSDRKRGYYLFKKTLHCFAIKSKNINSFWCSVDECQNIEQSWRLYITILENLEENQAHLILPTLKNLDELIKSKRLQSSWLDILYMRILTHNNNLVLRWAVEFFLQTFTCSDLSTDILKHLLETSNTNSLFNYESYFINMEYISSFLKGDLINIYTVIGDVNWKSIPLYIWLSNLSENSMPNAITSEVILKISSRVRALQNFTIRKKTIAICNKIFEHFISEMSMEEYITYVETLYNTSDEYLEYETIYSKKSSLIKANSVVFKQRFFEIIGNEVFQKPYGMDFKLKTFINFLYEIPMEQHGFLRFLPYHYQVFSSTHLEDLELIAKLYKLDLHITKLLALPSIISTFENCLIGPGSNDKQEIEHCRLAGISFYIQNIKNLDNVEDETLRLIFNSKLSENTIFWLSIRLYETKKQLSKWIIDEFINIIHNKQMLYHIIQHLEQTCNNNVRDAYIEAIWEKYPQFMYYSLATILELSHQTRFFYADVSKGELRIEQLFCFRKFGEYKSKSDSLKEVWLFAIEEYCDAKYISYLLKCHKELTKQSPRYFENSNEHRFKLRIAIGILYAHLNKTIGSTDVFNEIWDILINENNQLNISYIYEFILGVYDEREAVILEKLNQAHNLTSRQQVSIISVAYTFSLKRNLNSTIKETIISDLQSLSMGANFQTRLFAQMALFKLLQNDKFKDALYRKQILESITKATGEKFTDYLNDIRIHMYDIENWDLNQYDSKVHFKILKTMLYITNVPFDEIIDPTFKISHLNCPRLQNQVIKCRETFLKKTKSAPEEEVSDLNDQLQRKMNPVNDVTVHNNLIIYPVKEKSTEMFVIASLIDKLPNLGGIARTCEVLGINNLVMDSKKHTDKNEFKNLSMTAENSLNIIEVKPKDLKEFLMNKQMQGFKVVGAEQTSNSQNFESFEFPKKCILLLGHEKDGIPAPLLGLLDYAVEIPQFGQVRSLNVHVTGALFMWEFCKQHLIQK